MEELTEDRGQHMQASGDVRAEWAAWRAGAREEGVGPGRESSEDLGKVEEGGSRREPGDGEKQWHSEGSQRRRWAGRG